VACEHSHIRLREGSKNEYFCVECGSSFILSSAGLEKFITHREKPGEERVKEFYELKLNEEQKEWLLKLLRSKRRGCDYYLRIRKGLFATFTPEKQAKIRQSFRISEELIAKLTALA